MPGEIISRWFSILGNNRGEVKEKDEPEVEEEVEEEGLEIELDEEEEGEGLEVDLDEEEEEEEEDDGEKKKSKQNKKFAQMRVENKKLVEDNEKLKRAAQTKAPAPHVQGAQPQGSTTNPNDPRNWTEDQWDVYAKKDWKGAIDLRSQINAEDVVEKHTKVTVDNTTLEKHKKVVSEKHPELNDDTSEKTKIYLQVLEENPRYLTDPKGPIHAMRDMEDRMRELGYPEDEVVAAEKRGAARERKRQDRVTLTSQKGRHTSNSDRKVQLTKDEVEFCKFNDIDPKEYAKNKHKLSKNKGGLQV